MSFKALTRVFDVVRDVRWRMGQIGHLVDRPLDQYLVQRVVEWHRELVGEQLQAIANQSKQVVSAHVLRFASDDDKRQVNIIS